MKTIKIQLIIEILILWAIGIVSMYEGLRLIIYKDPYVLYDALGPGSFILVVSIAFIIAGAVHLVVNYNKSETVRIAKVADRKMRIQAISTMVNCGMYAFLVGRVGYLTATFVFFFVQFRVVGIKSWVRNIRLTLALTAVYYVLFVKLCGLIFPRGNFLSKFF